jgi:hypothetical protein
MAKKTKAVKKSFPSARKFALRRDATVGTGEAVMERVFGLPKGSVQLALPDGKLARADKKIGALLRDWDW